MTSTDGLLSLFELPINCIRTCEKAGESKGAKRAGQRCKSMKAGEREFKLFVNQKRATWDFFPLHGYKEIDLVFFSSSRGSMAVVWRQTLNLTQLQRKSFIQKYCEDLFFMFFFFFCSNLHKAFLVFLTILVISTDIICKYVPPGMFTGQFSPVIWRCTFGAVYVWRSRVEQTWEMA